MLGTHDSTSPSRSGHRDGEEHEEPDSRPNQERGMEAEEHHIASGQV